MSALGRRLRLAQGGRVAFMCPGCNEPHMIPVNDGDGPRWTWDGSIDAPTFSPSIRVTGNAIVCDDAGNWTGEWQRDEAGNLVPFVCHSFVRGGRIEFCPDSTHQLSGQTVDLPPWPYSEEESP